MLAAALGAGCASDDRVTRIADGAREQGRYIDSYAYSAYAQGALLEAAGDERGALRAFLAALEVDDDSPDIWTRIGSLHCRLGKTEEPSASSAAAGFAAFAEALELDPSYSAAYAARAHCLERLGRLEEALAQALLAVRYDPDRVSLTEQVTRLLFSLGRKEQAWDWLEALVVRQPASPQAWRAFRLAAELDRDATRLRRARAAEQGLGLGPPHDRGAGALRSDAIDALLLAGDLEGARRAAVTQRWSASLLAIRAVELGAYEAAREQAKFVLAADPDATDAWVALLVASEQLRDRDGFAEALSAQSGGGDRPSARAVELFAALLARRTGEASARAFRDSYARGSR